MSYEQEENTDSFRFARRKKQTRQQISNPPLTAFSPSFAPHQLTKTIDSKMQTIRASYFWSRFEHHLLEWLDRQSTPIDILSYGLGHISSSLSSQLQYALLKLIEQTMSTKIDTVYMYDPIWTPAERDFLQCTHSSPSYEVFLHNNQALQTTVRPSLVYVPFCSKPIHNNLLYSNWTKQQLKAMLFFGNSLDKFCNEVQFDRQKFTYIDHAARFATDVSLPAFDDYPNAFNEQCLTFFDRTSVPVAPDRQPTAESKRDTHRKSRATPIVREKVTIEQMSEHIWLTSVTPTYSNDDEIVVDTQRASHAP